MVVKRRNHGRSRKNCGSSGKLVSCDGCGSRVAKDKVRRRRRRRGPRGALFFFCLLGRPGPGGGEGRLEVRRVPRAPLAAGRMRHGGGRASLRFARRARRRVGGPLRGAERCPLRARSPFLGILVPAHYVGEARARCPRRRASYGGAERLRGRHEPRAGKFPPSPSPARLTAATRERRRDPASLRRCPRV